MKIILFFLGLTIVGATLAQTPERKVYINPAFGLFRLTTDPRNINNAPLMIEVKIGTDIGKKGIIGLQFSSALQRIATMRHFHMQPPPGIPLFSSESGELKHQLTAIGFFYERLFSVGRHVDLFPSAYIQYLDFSETEKGRIFTPLDSSMKYSRQMVNNFSGRLGINFNAKYRMNQSVCITFRFAQIDCRIWDPSRNNISAELPFLIGIKYAY